MTKHDSRIIILTGAPLSNSLDWKEDALCAPLQPCFLQSDGKPLAPVSSIDAKPTWRHLELERIHLSTGLTKASKMDVGDEEEASFLSTEGLSLISSPPDENSLQASMVSQYSQDDVLSQFYEHSFAIHEEIPSSRIMHRDSFVDTSCFSDAKDASLISSESIGTVSQQNLPPSMLSVGRLVDLQDVPNAAYLRSIEPQTMTVNLVVGIISISQPRLITTHKARRKVELLEMLVGDDTKAGFGVNIWLHPDESGLSKGGMRSEVAQLRPQDIVLMRNVALTSFRGKVYGQSLRKDTTTLKLLYRSALDINDRQGIYSAQELDVGRVKDICTAKVANVKRWVMAFVGASIASRQETRQTRAREGQEVNEKQMIALPPDTQP